MVAWEEAQPLSTWEQRDSHSIHLRKGGGTANAPKSHAQELTDTQPTPRSPVFISVLEMKKKKKTTLRAHRSRRSTAECYPREPGLWGFCSSLISEKRLYCSLPCYRLLQPLDLYTPFLRFASFYVNEQTAARNE